MIESEQPLILGYLNNLLGTAPCRPGLLREVAEFLDSYRKMQGDEDEFLTELLEDLQSEPGPTNRAGRAAMRKTVQMLRGLIQERQGTMEKAPPGLFEANLALLATHFKFDALERGFLGLVVLHQRSDGFSRMVNTLSREHLGTLSTCSFLLGVTEEELANRLAPTGRLLQSGVLEMRRNTGCDLDDLYQVIDPVLRALHRCQGGRRTLLKEILGEPTRASLEWEDFAHQAPLRERLEAFLQQASSRRLAGVNILLWGPPGTGKTEFCKTLSTRLGMKLYAVGEQDEDGDEPARHQRIAAYRLSQNLLRLVKGSLLMFDEMDDLFASSGLRGLLGGPYPAGSKVFMNRLLENNPVPTFWIVNNVELLDEAFIRRMSLAVEFKSPPASVRERVWTRVLQRHQVDMAAEEMRQLAELNIPPAVVDSAARFTRQIDGGAEEFHFASQGIIHAMRGGRPLPRPEQPQSFCPELTSADLDLSALTSQLKQAGSRAFSLCLYGPPGTGKSAYLRHLAEAMQLPVMQKRASDLLDMFVGGSEKQIAAAFQEAIDREALLIFDEADSMLADRRQAMRSWEVSQVNEMLTWMERHPLPFACTTNLMEHLDPASLRRFTFKLAFRFMTREQTAQAFQLFFNWHAPESLQRLQRLTPGDFAVVRKKAEVLGALADPDTLVRFLAQEEDEKRLNRTSIGFSR